MKISKIPLLSQILTTFSRIISVQDVFTEYDLGNEDLEPHYEEEFNIEADYEEEAICGEELYYTIMDLD